MAVPLHPDRITALFRAEGLDVYELPGWRDRCRCHTGAHTAGGPGVRPWGPIHGVTLHVTTGPRLTGQAAVDYAWRILVGGNGSVPGPLCLAGVDGDGRILMVAGGRANHVGSVSARAAAMMRAASFPLSGYVDARGSGTDGNTMTYGFEALGPSGPSPAQQETMVRAAAAICRAYGWDGGEVHGHGEVSSQRSYSDPGCDMGAIRARVRARVAQPAGIAGPTTPAAPAAAPTLKEDPMIVLTITDHGMALLAGGVVYPLGPAAADVVGQLPGVQRATINEAQYGALRASLPTYDGGVADVESAVARALAGVRLTLAVAQ